MQDSLFREVVVFYGELSEFHTEDYLPLLSAEERIRSGKYLLEEDREGFIIIRGILKRLLSVVSNCNENELDMESGRHGKPFLKNDPDLQFNVSHAGEAFVIGLSHAGEIGVDIENRNRKVNFTKLEHELFTPGELTRFQAMNPAEKQACFIDTWTRKEAFLKAHGSGLTQAMHQLELMDGIPDASGDCFIENKTLLEHYRAAVVVKGHVNCCKWIPVAKSAYLINTTSHI